MDSSLENKIDVLSSAKTASRFITKDAKHLSYPITDIVVKLSCLAENHNLSDEMEVLLREVNKASNELESAIFKCEEVFSDALREAETKLEELEAV